MGAGADVNAFFGIMTMFIAIPTGVLIYNWLATMFRGRITFASPMYWFMGFVVTFTLGGMAGVILGMPGLDYLLHNTLFLVAHFHTMAIGGALFGIFAGITYWWPKVTGFKLNEKIGKRAFWFWLTGFFVSFTPLYILGFMGATRRMDHYAASTGYQALFITSGFGLIIIATGAALQVWQIIVSVKERKQNLDTTGDPWDGRTLEWATTSPPPFYNFAVIPTVTDRDAFWESKQSAVIARSRAISNTSRDDEAILSSEINNRLLQSDALPRNDIVYQDIEMPKNTAMGIYVSAFCLLLGFAMVWHIWWLAVFGLIGAIVCVIIRAFDEETEYVIPAAEVERMEKAKARN
jgi:cytochrome o ubiquinol oxidase subunit 1